MTKSLLIRPLEESDIDDVISLWRECGLVTPWNDPRRDIARKRMVDAELFLVGEVAEELVASVMAGYEGHRGWINYLAVRFELRRMGYGQQMMGEAEKQLRARGCPKINLQIRKTNTAVIDFYTSQGYAVDEVVSLGKRLENDESSQAD